MKTLISIFALTLALAFTVTAFAGDVTAAKKAEEQCEKDGGSWDAKTESCSGKIEVLTGAATRLRHLICGQALDKTFHRPTALQMLVVDFRLRARNDFPADLLNLGASSHPRRDRAVVLARIVDPVLVDHDFCHQNYSFPFGTHAALPANAKARELGWIARPVRGLLSAKL